MSSLDTGKKEVCEWIRANFPHGASCLDVGACDGKWAQLVGDHLDMDAVEIFRLNIVNHRLYNKYRKVFNADIREFIYEHYDLIIFGDVLEHMTVPEAQAVLAYAYPRCKDMIIGVPFNYPQGAIYGNPYEEHKQADLNHGLFMKRYPGFQSLILYHNYGYYVKDVAQCHTI